MHTVIGVAAPDFFGVVGVTPDVWVPLATQPQLYLRDARLPTTPTRTGLR
jgi:hypothetical protein